MSDRVFRTSFDTGHITARTDAADSTRLDALEKENADLKAKLAELQAKNEAEVRIDVAEAPRTPEWRKPHGIQGTPVAHPTEKGR